MVSARFGRRIFVDAQLVVPKWTVRGPVTTWIRCRETPGKRRMAEERLL
jgi:hypothetical protein